MSHYDILVTAIFAVIWLLFLASAALRLTGHRIRVQIILEKEG